MMHCDLSPQSPPTSQTQEKTSLKAIPTEPASVNDTWIRRHTVLTLITLLNRIRPFDGSVLMLSNRLCVKYGPRTDLSEASAMRFISEKTSIPVPKVYCAFEHHGQTYILMERINGEIVRRGWVDRSEESKAKILSRLAQMIREMRQLTPPGPGVTNVDGGSLFDQRLPGTSSRFGPFESIQAFHRYLRRDFTVNPNLDPEVNELIKLQDRPYPPPTFTHGDLSSLNILVRGDEVVGLIDWETSGWFPSYWEYTTACQVNPHNYFWRDEIDKFLDPMPTELRMEQIRQKYFGDF